MAPCRSLRVDLGALHSKAQLWCLQSGLPVAAELVLEQNQYRRCPPREGRFQGARRPTSELGGETEHASVTTVNEARRGARASAAIKLETMESFCHEPLSFRGLAMLRSGKKTSDQEKQSCQQWLIGPNARVPKPQLSQPT